MLQFLNDSLPRSAPAAFALMVFGAAAADTLSVGFDGTLDRSDGAKPVRAEAITFAEGIAGQAAVIVRPGVLAYAPDGLHPDGFTLSLRIRHPKDIQSYFYRRLTYVYHQTSDTRNRISLVKRAGTNALVFSMSNGAGPAKGDDFGGDWFALAVGSLSWRGGSWHRVTVTADRKVGLAQVFVDGRKVAEARGNQLPERFGEALWVGSEMGHSWMEGRVDDLRIESVSRLQPGPVRTYPGPLYRPIPPSPPLLGATLGQLTGKEISLNLDFFDICIGLDTWDMRYCEREMERLVAMTAHYGFDRLFYRVSVCGAVAYRTKVMTPAEEPAFENYRARKTIVDGPCASIPSVHMRLADVMRSIDPLESCATYGRKHGLPVYAWITSWDSMYYATPDEFFRKHPEYTWVSRDGAEHIPGVPCYAYPEVRAYRLAQIRELLEYDIDGILLSPRSHSPWPGRNRASTEIGSRDYGYNEPVLRAYRKRYGKDPRKNARDSLDELRFVTLKAEFFTEFLREAKNQCDRKGKKLVLVTSESISDPIRATRMYIDAETIARQGLVHELCFMGGAGTDLTRWRLAGDDRVKLTTWASIHGRDYDACLARMRTQLGALLTNPTSAGSTFHELANLIYPDCWQEAVIDPVRDHLDRPGNQ